MASRRMFSLDVVDTDKFLEMPVTTQALYFHLGMRADDDGFVSSPKKITKFIGCNDDDLKLLIAKCFIIPFESGVIVIADWKTNNYIRNDRYKETLHQNEKACLTENNGTYSLDTCGIPDVYQMDTQVRLGKDSIVKDNKKTVCPEPKPTPDPSGILLPLVDKSIYNVPKSKIEKWAVAYPAVNIEQELHKMSAWLESNPQRRKTRRGIERFINNWLSKEQDRGGIYKNGSRQQAVRPVEKPDYYQSLGKCPPSPDDPFQ
ncbi:MAG: replisome organizer [Eubacteriales bacterium]|nr:replisome organizer [Eubacteriales bacterium]